MKFMKVQAGLYIWGPYTIEFVHDFPELDWRIFRDGEWVSSHPTLKICKSQVRSWEAQEGHY
jgi:hypothetical protein